MDFIVSATTDIGNIKDTNQDSYNVKVLNTEVGKMAFAVLCDGMGGLSKGEVASASVVKAFCSWVETRLPVLCASGLNDADIQKALPLCSSDGVTINGQDITLPSDDIQFDVGAIAKGYIADRLKDFLVKKGVNSAIINLGGNVLCIGSKPDGTPFKVGIQKPFADRNETEAVMDITGKSVVSSGIYERCFKQDGKLYHHILNPKTGYPYDNGLISVTIISDQSVDGDALSTTCFALGLEGGLKFAEKKGVQAVFITEDYELHYTDGFRDEIRVTDVES